MQLSSLKKMSAYELMGLRDQVQRELAAKAGAERSELQRRLALLEGYDGSAQKRRGRGSSLKGRKVEPKYRNPQDRKETWSGRGLKPRWLSALLKRGRKIEEFAISGPGGAQKKSRKTRAARKRRGRKKRAA